MERKQKYRKRKEKVAKKNTNKNLHQLEEKVRGDDGFWTGGGGGYSEKVSGGKVSSMGASTSGEDVGTTPGETTTLEGLIAEANRILGKATEVITQTVEVEVGDAMRDLQEQATIKINETFGRIEEKLDEFSRQSKEAKACVRQKEAEFEAIRSEMKNGMQECCGKHKATLEKVQADRAIIHNEAKQFKLEAQRIIQNCMANSENRLECIRSGIAELGTRADGLVKKFEALVKREASTLAKSTKQMLDCNKRIVDEANKRYDRVVEEIDKCVRKI